MAQIPYQLAGARAAGVGGASVALSDIWSLQYNVGALAKVQSPRLTAGYQTRFNLPELSTAAVLLALPLPHGIVGASVSRYGFGAYQLTEASLAFAHQIRFASLGLQAGFVQTATTGFGSRMVPVLSLGGTAELIPKLRFGGSIYNILQAQSNPEHNEQLPTLLRAGLQWQASDLVQLLVETEKDVDFPARFKAGLEYQLRSFLALRSGFSTQPLQLHGGLGLQAGRISIDYAMHHHGHIGLNHHLSLGIVLREQK